MSSQQVHTLYKFCNIETALLILESGCLRFSSPHLFEDPYESHCNTPLPFNDEQFLNAYIKDTCDYIFARNDPSGTSALFVAIKRWRQEGRFDSEAEAGDVLKGLLKPMSEKQLYGTKKHFEEWQKFANSVRVATFTSNPNHLMNWHNLADNHRGLALRFRVTDENILSDPRQVIYHDAPSYLANLDDEVKKAFSSKKEDERIDVEDFYTLLTSKDSSFKEEKEWRSFYLEDEDKEMNPDQNLWFNDREFETTDISGIVFGYNMTDVNKTSIMDVVKTKYKKAKLFQANITQGEFGLVFDKIE